MGRLHINKEYYGNAKQTILKAQEEMDSGLNLLNSVDKNIIAFFGSHKGEGNNAHYQKCEELAFQLGKKDYAILSGGGSGIMKAANSGAMRAQAPSIGLRAELLTKEKIEDPIFTHQMSFRFLFVRRFLMAIKSEALIFFPGGLGTLNEVFEYGMLMQTRIADRVPMILVGKEYWNGIMSWMQEKLPERLLIENTDLELFQMEDDISKIIEKIHF
jgi:uncharacterized protein (TIGR00730 family)